MVDKKISDTLQKAESDFENADKLFDKNSSDLKRKAAHPPVCIALTAEDEQYCLQRQLEFNKKIVEEFAEITANYWASCEVTILSLDEICRPLLSENPSAKVVGEVARFIKKVIDEVSDVTVNFSVSFNHIDLGEAGSFNPKSSVLSQTVGKFWEITYEQHPGYKEDAQRLKAEEEERENAIRLKKEKENEKIKIQKQETDNRIKTDTLLEDYYIKIKEKREKAIIECNNLVAQFKKKLDDETARLKPIIIQTEKNRLNTLIANKKEDISKMKGSSFAEAKKEARRELSNLKKLLRKAPKSQEVLDKFRKIESLSFKAYNDYKKQIDDYINKRFTFLGVSRNMTMPKTEDSSKYYYFEKILGVVSDKPMFISEIAEKCDIFYITKAENLIKELRSQGYLKLVFTNDWKATYIFSPDINVKTIEKWSEDSTLEEKGYPLPPTNLSQRFEL